MANAATPHIMGGPPHFPPQVFGAPRVLADQQRRDVALDHCPDGCRTGLAHRVGLAETFLAPVAAHFHRDQAKIPHLTAGGIAQHLRQRDVIQTGFNRFDFHDRLTAPLSRRPSPQQCWTSRGPARPAFSPGGPSSHERCADRRLLSCSDRSLVLHLAHHPNSSTPHLRWVYGRRPAAGQDHRAGRRNRIVSGALRAWRCIRSRSRWGRLNQ